MLAALCCTGSVKGPQSGCQGCVKSLSVFLIKPQYEQEFSLPGLPREKAQEAEQKTLMVVILRAAEFSFPYAEVFWNYDCPLCCDLIMIIHCISNMLECELLAFGFSEFLWLSFLTLCAFIPWGYLGKEIHE